jgi:hypothetical protein
MVPLFAVSSARAQSKPPGASKQEADAVTDKAGQLFDEGTRALEAGRWEQARASFLAAWALKKHWQIAANLGDAEMKLGHYADAARSYAYYEREAPANRKEKAKGLFESARKKVGMVQVQTDRPDAEVLVGGVLAGKSPLNEPVFVMPGKHAFQMRVNEQVVAEQGIEAAAGGSYEVMLQAKAEPPAAPAPAASKSIAPAHATTRVPAAEKPSAVEKPALGWVIAGGAAALAGIGVGTGMIVVANGKDAERERILNELQARDGPSPCASGRPVENAQKCAEITTLANARQQFQGVAAGAFVLGGAAAVATGLYAFWPRNEARPLRVTVIPLLAPGSAGVSVGARF